MTFFRKDPGDISNHFDELFKDIGHRGSSFMDIDKLWIVHDGRTGRFLMFEFKNRNEKLSGSQEWVLTEFAKLPGCKSVAIWYDGEDDYKVIYYPDKVDDRVGERALQQMLKDWWEQSHRQPGAA
jgi:hypothetical protein